MNFNEIRNYLSIKSVKLGQGGSVPTFFLHTWTRLKKKISSILSHRKVYSKSIEWSLFKINMHAYSMSIKMLFT